MAESVGVLILFALISVPACLYLVIAGRGAGSSGPAREESAAPSPAPAAKPAPETARGAVPGASLLVAAIAYLVLQAAVLLLVPWVLFFVELGPVGLVSGALFALPLLVGFAYLWRRGALDG
ncbi:MAG: NADH-quinone oxidoreductase subunit A [Myxococcota bacterium]|nr:NADH-quinone oxidoreductase subunit A [Myxococcota bacterium]